MTPMSPRRLSAVLLLLALALAASNGAGQGSFRPVPRTAVAADSLIRPGETHFAHL